MKKINILALFLNLFFTSCLKNNYNRRATFSKRFCKHDNSLLIYEPEENKQKKIRFHCSKNEISPYFVYDPEDNLINLIPYNII